MRHHSFSCGNPARPRPGENTGSQFFIWNFSFSHSSDIEWLYIYNLKTIHCPLASDCPPKSSWQLPLSQLANFAGCRQLATTLCNVTLIDWIGRFQCRHHVCGKAVVWDMLNFIFQFGTFSTFFKCVHVCQLRCMQIEICPCTCTVTVLCTTVSGHPYL